MNHGPRKTRHWTHWSSSASEGLPHPTGESHGSRARKTTDAGEVAGRWETVHSTPPGCFCGRMLRSWRPRLRSSASPASGGLRTPECSSPSSLLPCDSETNSAVSQPHVLLGVGRCKHHTYVDSRIVHPHGLCQCLLGTAV